MRIDETRRWGIQQLVVDNLNKDGTSELSLVIDLILGYILKKDRSYLYAYNDKQLSEYECSRFKQAIQKYSYGVPVAYITGTKSFYKLDFKIDESCLVPRPATEVLVKLGSNFITYRLQRQLMNGNDTINVLDLGTGSGIIIISLAHDFQYSNSVNFYATDKNEATLAAARHNANTHKVNINFKLGDWFMALSEHKKIKFDCILANPPYVAVNSPYLSQLKFEPKHALVAEKNGIADLETIIQSASFYLKKNGTLMLEHGYDQADTVRRLLSLANYNSITTLKDLAQLDRVSFGCYGNCDVFTKNHASI